MYGGYDPRDVPSAVRTLPIRIENQPTFGVGKYTTAWDRARPPAPSTSRARARDRCFTSASAATEARYLLWLLAQVADRGKLDRFLRGPVVMHKAGWLTGARHDNGIVAFDGGVFVATVMTWQSARPTSSRAGSR